MSKRSDGDWGETELDATERADAEINLDDPSAGDNEPWSPPDRQPRGAEFYDVESETLSMRVRQEEPDITADADSESDESTYVSDESGPEADAMHVE